MTIVVSSVQRVFKSLGKLGPPPTMDWPLRDIGWSKVTRISVVAGSTPSSPLSGVALTTVGGADKAGIVSRAINRTGSRRCIVILHDRQECRLRIVIISLAGVARQVGYYVCCRSRTKNLGPAGLEALLCRLVLTGGLP